MADKQVIRQATHAGSWYSSNKTELNKQLDQWLEDVGDHLHCIGPLSQGTQLAELPVPRALIIIAPHAGYTYSGPAAAYAYKSWDVSKAKRIFLIGPSHHFYLPNAALSRCTQYATPFGNLVVDVETTRELSTTGQFDWMTKDIDEDEHSLEMHLPYIYKILSRQHSNGEAAFPPIVPILVGNTSARMEAKLGEVLAVYLADPETAFVISSDFAHWGLRFRYTYYQPNHGPAKQLSSSQRTKLDDPPIHESIKAIDFACMGECESGQHKKWLSELEETGNTVCGRHPIGVVMAAVEVLQKQNNDTDTGRFKFIRYERSSLVERVSDSSVSYASAFAVLQ